MSADLYTSNIDSNVFGDLHVEMPVGGNLRIIAYDPGNRDLVGCFTLPPNPEGWKEAENLVSALREWVRHSKELQHSDQQTNEAAKCESCAEGQGGTVSRIYAIREDNGVRSLHRIKCDSGDSEIAPSPDISTSGWTRRGTDRGLGSDKLEWDYCPRCS